MTVELQTLGYVIDNLKSGQYAIKVLGANQGMRLYISQGKTLCCNGEQVIIDMTHNGNSSKQWAIVSVNGS
jgi:hypothetical protein